MCQDKARCPAGRAEARRAVRLPSLASAAWVHVTDSGSQAEHLVASRIGPQVNYDSEQITQEAEAGGSLKFQDS